MPMHGCGTMDMPRTGNERTGSEGKGRSGGEDDTDMTSSGEAGSGKTNSDEMSRYVLIRQINCVSSAVPFLVHPPFITTFTECTFTTYTLDHLRTVFVGPVMRGMHAYSGYESTVVVVCGEEVYVLKRGRVHACRRLCTCLCDRRTDSTNRTMACSEETCTCLCARHAGKDADRTAVCVCTGKDVDRTTACKHTDSTNRTMACRHTGSTMACSEETCRHTGSTMTVCYDDRLVVLHGCVTVLAHDLSVLHTLPYADAYHIARLTGNKLLVAHGGGLTVYHVRTFRAVHTHVVPFAVRRMCSAGYDCFLVTDGGIVAMNVRSGRTRHVTGTCDRAIRSVAVDVAGRLLAVVDDSGGMCLYEMERGMVVERMHGVYHCECIDGCYVVSRHGSVGRCDLYVYVLDRYRLRMVRCRRALHGRIVGMHSHGTQGVVLVGRHGVCRTGYYRDEQARVTDMPNRTITGCDSNGMLVVVYRHTDGGMGVSAIGSDGREHVLFTCHNNVIRTARLSECGSYVLVVLSDRVLCVNASSRLVYWSVDMAVADCVYVRGMVLLYDGTALCLHGMCRGMLDGEYVGMRTAGNVAVVVCKRRVVVVDVWQTAKHWRVTGNGTNGKKEMVNDSEEMVNGKKEMASTTSGTVSEVFTVIRDVPFDEDIRQFSMDRNGCTVALLLSSSAMVYDMLNRRVLGVIDGVYDSVVRSENGEYVLVSKGDVVEMYADRRWYGKEEGTAVDRHAHVADTGSDDGLVLETLSYLEYERG